MMVEIKRWKTEPRQAYPRDPPILAGLLKILGLPLVWYTIHHQIPWLRYLEIWEADGGWLVDLWRNHVSQSFWGRGGWCMGTQMVGPLLVEEGMKDIEICWVSKIIRGKVMQSSSLIDEWFVTSSIFYCNSEEFQDTNLSHYQFSIIDFQELVS